VQADQPAEPLHSGADAAAGNNDGPVRKAGRKMLFLVLLVCAAPIIASYFTYYVLKPEKRNNYGTLIDQRAHPVPEALATTTLDGRPQALAQFKGKWVMLMTAPGACAKPCRDQLFAMRQLRTMQGKEMERIERVWLITDGAPLDTVLIREFDGTHMLRADGAAVKAWLPADAGTSTDGHLYMIDPLGHLMMRFPHDAEPRKVYKDIYKLLKASAVG
jgi:hypothetical protein